MSGRWNPLVAGACGIGIGALVAGFSVLGDWGAGPFEYQVGQLVGGAVGGGAALALVAVVRNLLIGNRADPPRS
jgi:hypothetical protein